MPMAADIRRKITSNWSTLDGRLQDRAAASAVGRFLGRRVRWKGSATTLTLDARTSLSFTAKVDSRKALFAPVLAVGYAAIWAATGEVMANWARASPALKVRATTGTAALIADGSRAVRRGFLHQCPQRSERHQAFWPIHPRWASATSSDHQKYAGYPGIAPPLLSLMCCKAPAPAASISLLLQCLCADGSSPARRWTLLARRGNTLAARHIQRPKIAKAQRINAIVSPRHVARQVPLRN